MRVFLAVTLLLSVPAGASAQIDPKTAILEKAGFDALNSGDVDRAIAAFREAVVADPKNARLHLGLGVAAYEQQRYPDARPELERALALEPALDEAREFLGLVMYRQGDLFGAIRVYDDWLSKPRAGDARERAAATLERWRHELTLRDGMDQKLGDHFTVSFEGPKEAALASQAVDALERAYWRIGPLLGIYPERAVPVVLYTAEQFQDITRAPAWAAAAYDGTIRVPVRGALDAPQELERVLAHEFTHALVHTLSARAIPTWLNEGLASALESDDPAAAGNTADQPSFPIPLAALTSSFGRLSGREAAAAYAESAIAVRILLEEIGGTGVANLIRDLGNGVSFDAAFAHRAQVSFTDFSARLSR